jgi:hypothetical protein
MYVGIPPPQNVEERSGSWQHNTWSPNPCNFPYTARTVTAAAVITALSLIFKKVSVIKMCTWNYDY